MRKKTNGVKAWSLSALQVYEQCPARYKAERINKIGDKLPSPAMERGIAIHAKGEQYLRGNIPNVPKEFEPFSKEMKNLRKLKASPEKKMAVTKAWKPTEFFADDAWLRLVVDAEVELPSGLLLIDFKTGRIYPDKHNDQSHLYSTCYLGECENITTEFWYLDQDDIRSASHNSSCVREYRQYWEGRVAPLFAETKWPTSPSTMGCRYCAIRERCPDAVE